MKRVSADEIDLFLMLKRRAVGDKENFTSWDVRGWRDSNRGVNVEEFVEIQRGLAALVKKELIEPLSHKTGGRPQEVFYRVRRRS